jgi:hypothetical protein
MPTVPNLAALRAVRDADERARAAKDYIGERQRAIAQAQGIRDDAIRELLSAHGVTATARLCGVSVSHVKAVRLKMATARER